MEQAVEQTKSVPAHSGFFQNTGLWAALGAMGLWGVLPLYWKLLEPFPAFEILCQRVVWSCLFMLPLALYTGTLGKVLQALRSWRVVRIFMLSGLLLACNWLMFIWAVNHDRVLETSLGYYINPMLTVCLGVVFFKDRPRPLQWLAIALVTTGVAAQVVFLGSVPLIALGLAVTFGIYGALRKMAPMESLPGLTLETILLLPVALGFIFWDTWNGAAVFPAASLDLKATLAASGAVTTVPLVWFAHSARKLSLMTLGILQYLSPSITFLLGIFVFQEPFTTAHAMSFSCIWAALALYTFDTWRGVARGCRSIS